MCSHIVATLRPAVFQMERADLVPLPGASLRTCLVLMECFRIQNGLCVSDTVLFWLRKGPPDSEMAIFVLKGHFRLLMEPFEPQSCLFCLEKVLFRLQNIFFRLLIDHFWLKSAPFRLRTCTIWHMTEPPSLTFNLVFLVRKLSSFRKVDNGRKMILVVVAP